MQPKLKLPTKRASLRGVGKAALAGGALLIGAGPALAADAAATGIDGSFITLLGDLNGMLDGNFGALVLLISLIIAAGVYAVTSNFRYVIASLMVAFLVGYGFDIITGIGGVTASTDMVDLAALDVTTQFSPVTVQ